MRNKKRIASALCFGAVGAVTFAVDCSTSAIAQSTLPPVTVEAPKKKNTTPKQGAASSTSRSRTVVRSRQAQRSGAPAVQPTPGAAGAGVENPQGPINGYVANRTLTGTKTNTQLNEIPQSISVIGAEQIRDQKPQSFDQILRYTPGAGGELFGSDTRSDWLFVRGFNVQQDGFFLDGLSLFNTAFATWKLQPFALERVEILRGPASVLYGGGSPGGIVNAVSKMPSPEPIRYIETGVNNYGNAYLSFDFGGPANLPPGSGTLDYRIVGTIKGGDTQVDYTQDNSYYIAPSVTYRPDADTRITVLAQASHDKTNGNNWLPYVGTVTPAPFGRISTSLFTSQPGQDYVKRDQEMIGYQFEHDLNNNLTFRQNMRYAHVDVNINEYLGNNYVLTGTPATPDPSTATLNTYRFFTHDTGDLAQIDNQLEGRFNTGAISHKVIGGLDYKTYTLDDYQATGFLPSGSGYVPLNVLNPVYGGYAPLGTPYSNRVLDQQQVGLYLQDQMKLDRWTFVISGRNDWVDTDNTNRNAPTPTSPAFQSSDSSKATWRTGLIYAWDYGLSPYVSYATSFNPVLGTTATGQLFLPEEGKQFEAGVKWEPAGFNGHVDFAWFDLRRTNVLTTDPTAPTFQIQNGEVVSRGVELSAVSNLTPEFKMVGSFTKYDLFVSKDLNPALIGTTPVGIPSLLASLWGDYTFKSGLLTGFGFGAGVRYVGESYADQANQFVVPGRVLGDLAVHYDWGNNWRAQVNVTNIADTTYVASCSTTSACFYGDRRRVLGSLAYQW